MECANNGSDKAKEIFCPTCKRPHQTRPGNRVKICISSSPLHDFWNSDESYEGDSVHVEYITIPNARINELTVAWEIQYLHDPRPMDVLLIGGLDNLQKGHKRESILRAYGHLVELVKWQEEKYHPNVQNSCGIATLYYPPKLCSFDESGLVSGRSENLLEMMMQLNADIEHLNAKSGVKVPNFKRLGIRKSVKGSRKTRHRWEHWEGEDPKVAIQLRRDQRLKMVSQVGKYFKHETF